MDQSPKKRAEKAFKVTSLKTFLRNQGKADKGSEDVLRRWIHDHELVEFLLRAVSGEVFNNQRLSLRDRCNLATKLLNKTLPDMKTVECIQSPSDSPDAVTYQATQNLLQSALNLPNKD